MNGKKYKAFIVKYHYYPVLSHISNVENDSKHMEHTIILSEYASGQWKTGDHYHLWSDVSDDFKVGECKLLFHINFIGKRKWKKER